MFNTDLLLPFKTTIDKPKSSLFFVFFLFVHITDTFPQLAIYVIILLGNENIVILYNCVEQVAQC